MSAGFIIMALGELMGVTDRTPAAAFGDRIAGASETLGIGVLLGLVATGIAFLSEERARSTNLQNIQNSIAIFFGLLLVGLVFSGARILADPSRLGDASTQILLSTLAAGASALITIAASLQRLPWTLAAARLTLMLVSVPYIATQLVLMGELNDRLLMSIGIWLIVVGATWSSLSLKRCVATFRAERKRVLAKLGLVAVVCGLIVMSLSGSGLASAVFILVIAYATKDDSKLVIALLEPWRKDLH